MSLLASFFTRPGGRIIQHCQFGFAKLLFRIPFTDSWVVWSARSATWRISAEDHWVKR